MYYEESLEIQKLVDEMGTTDKEKTDYLKSQLFCSIGAINESRGRFNVALENNFQAMTNIHIGNSKKSIEYFGKTLDANRAYSNKNFQASLSEMEVQYDTEKVKVKIVSLENEKLMTVIMGGVIVVLLLSIVVSLLVSYRLMLNKKRLAENTIKQLEQEAQLIATQAVLDGETRERARLARDLHDGLGSLLTGVKLNLENMKKGIFLRQFKMAIEQKLV